MKNELFHIPSFGTVSKRLDLDGFKSTEILDILKVLLTARLFEEKCAEAKKNGLIGGPVHLAVGQEAIPVGISRMLTHKDFIFSAHRSHSHLIALGTDSRSLFAEILGKETGLSGGFGGSMHLVDEVNGFYGSVPIVSGTIPIALGAAFSAKYSNPSSIAVVYFGDGAVEEGVLHESLNLAATLHLPILFVCENNFMASHMHLTQRQKLAEITRFATANGIESARIDGNNVLDMVRLVNQVIPAMRESGKPFFIEGLTFRHLGHVDWREDIDVGVDRSAAEVKQWKEMDPILRLSESAIEDSLISELEIDKLRREIKIKIENDFKLAMGDPFPDEKTILKNVLG